jgi:hypothetical protein
MDSDDTGSSADNIPLKRKYLGSSRDNLPIYDVKRSRTNNTQQCGIDWMTTAGKDTFKSHLESILAQWGVKPAHANSNTPCVLVPADWAAADPVAVMEMFNFQSCPGRHDERLVSSINIVYKSELTCVAL